MGFTVDAAGNCLVGGVRLVIEGGDQGLCAWSLDGIESGGGIDGLATHRVARRRRRAASRPARTRTGSSPSTTSW